MNKVELVAAIAQKANVTKKDSEAVLTAFIDVVSEQLHNREKMPLVGMDVFDISQYKADGISKERVKES